MPRGQYPLDQSLGDQAFGIGSIAAENARFMSRVYGWMTAGLCITGAVAWNVAGNPRLVQAILGNRPLFWGLIIAQLGAVVALSGLINRIGAMTATLIYFLYAGLTGLTLSSIFLVFTGSSIAQVFAVTAIGFAGLSGVGYVTKRDLGPVGSFCMMGLFGLVGFGLLAIFFPSLMGQAASFVYSIVGVHDHHLAAGDLAAPARLRLRPHAAVGGHLHAAAHRWVPHCRADLRYAVRPLRGAAFRHRGHALHGRRLRPAELLPVDFSYWLFAPLLLPMGLSNGLFMSPTGRR